MCICYIACYVKTEMKKIDYTLQAFCVVDTFSRVELLML